MPDKKNSIMHSRLSSGADEQPDPMSASQRSGITQTPSRDKPRRGAAARRVSWADPPKPSESAIVHRGLACLVLPRSLRRPPSPSPPLFIRHRGGASPVHPSVPSLHCPPNRPARRRQRRGQREMAAASFTAAKFLAPVAARSGGERAPPLPAGASSSSFARTLRRGGPHHPALSPFLCMASITISRSLGQSQAMIFGE